MVIEKNRWPSKRLETSHPAGNAEESLTTAFFEDLEEVHLSEWNKLACSNRRTRRVTEISDYLWSPSEAADRSCWNLKKLPVHTARHSLQRVREASPDAAWSAGLITSRYRSWVCDPTLPSTELSCNLALREYTHWKTADLGCIGCTYGWLEVG